MKSGKAVIILLVLACDPLANKAAAADESFADIREKILQALKERKTPSIAVAVARGDRILWEEGFGWSDLENKIAASAHTPYMLGSTSKPITATAVLVLRESGQVELDQPVNNYLGDAKLHARIGNESEVTVRRVIQHTSGLPSYYQRFNPPEKPPPLDLVIRRYGTIMLLPGERFHYSNLGYGVLGGVIAHVSGKSFPEFLTEDVFAPLGMNDSSVVGQEKGVRASVPAPAIRYADDGKKLPEYTTAHAPASDICASVHDLARFGLFHLQGHRADQKAILSDKTIEEMQQCTVPMGKQAYGLGWHIRKDAKGRRQVLHGGASAGVDAQFTLIPEEKLCVAVLANMSRQVPGAVTEHVTNIILAKILGGDPEDFPIFRPNRPPKDSGLPGPLRGKWTGIIHTHQGDGPLFLWFRAGGDVDVQLADQPKTVLKEAGFESKVLTGKTTGTLAPSDTDAQLNDLEMELTLRGDVLNGIMYAIGQKGRFGLWTELRRAKGEE
jgi:CubicO group peptidase (beta-lactamase class C family)